MEAKRNTIFLMALQFLRQTDNSDEHSRCSTSQIDDGRSQGGLIESIVHDVAGTLWVYCSEITDGGCDLVQAKLNCGRSSSRGTDERQSAKFDGQLSGVHLRVAVQRVQEQSLR